jgi:hypothetical protein
MTQDILTDLGEEYWTKHDATAATFIVGVYNDATDGISDGDDVGAITTEPTNGNYSRQSTGVVAFDDGNWGVESNTAIQFDFSDQTTSEVVDTAFVVVNLAAVDTNDGGSNADHLVATAALTQDRDIGSIDTLEIAAGDLSVQLD